MRYDEQFPYILLFTPVGNQRRHIVYVVGDQLVEVEHILFGSIVCLDDRDASFFELSDVLCIVPFKRIQVLQIIPHLIVGLLVFQE